MKGKQLSHSFPKIQFNLKDFSPSISENIRIFSNGISVSMLLFLKKGKTANFTLLQYEIFPRKILKF